MALNLLSGIAMRNLHAILLALVPASAAMAEPSLMAKQPVTAASAAKRPLPVLTRAYRRQRAAGEKYSSSADARERFLALNQEWLKQHSRFLEVDARYQALGNGSGRETQGQTRLRPERDAAEMSMVKAAAANAASASSMLAAGVSATQVERLAARIEKNQSAIAPALEEKLDDLVVQRSTTARRLLMAKKFDAKAVAQRAVELIHVIDQLGARKPDTVVVAEGQSSSSSTKTGLGFNIGWGSMGFDDKDSSASSSSSWHAAQLLPKASKYVLDVEKMGTIEARIAATHLLDAATTIHALAVRDPKAAKPFMQWYNHSVVTFQTGNGSVDVQLASAAVDLPTVNSKAPGLLSPRMVSAMTTDVGRSSDRLLE